MQHLKDYVWMQRGNELPVKVPANEQDITQSLVAGFHQVDEPTPSKEKPE